MSSQEKTASKSISTTEFIVMMACLTSLVALSIDMILPALSTIGIDLNVSDSTTLPQVITTVFLGLSFGQVLFGPISDRFGRKPTIYVGLSIYVIGTLIAASAGSLTMLLAGRFVQGLGAGAPRIVSNAVIRDKFSGAEMARISSYIVAVFIFVPVVAPLLGQLMLLFIDWRAIFLMIVLLSILTGTWFGLRQEETLKPENVKRLNPKALWESALEIFRCRAALLYTISAGCIFGSFMTYLSTSQLVFKHLYDIEDTFALYFSSVAVVFGVGSVLNGRLVRRFGMKLLSRIAVSVLVGFSALYLIPAQGYDGRVPLWMWQCYLVVVFACLPFIFGNLNALSMEPLGHVAGMAATLIGTISTLIGLILATTTSLFYQQTVTPFVASFAIYGSGALLFMLIAGRESRPTNARAPAPGE